MKMQTYFNTETEREANICDLSRELIVNCSGAVNSVFGIKNSSIRNDFYLMYVVKGKMEMKLGEIKSAFSEGQFIIIKAGTTYSYQSESGNEICYLWIHFTGKNAESIVREYSLETNKIEYAGINGELFSLWKRLFREFILNDSFYKSTSAALLNEILAELSRCVSRTDKKERILKSISYIHENYSRELSVKELAEMEKLSLSYYRNCFKTITGVSPSQYLIDRRMDAAAALLENSNMKLNAISELVGYADPYYFGRLFKKKFGISPGRYRKQ